MVAPWHRALSDEENPTYSWGSQSASYLSDEAVESGAKITVNYPNGDIYNGTFTLDKEKDVGSYTTVTEGEPDEEGNPTKAVATYEGSFSGGLRSGLGKMTYPNGETYYGIWKEDKPDGDGSYSYANGDIYSGKWVAGSRSGKGAYKYSKDGSVVVGDWDSDKLVRGTWKRANGSEVGSTLSVTRS